MIHLAAAAQKLVHKWDLRAALAADDGEWAQATMIRLCIADVLDLLVEDARLTKSPGVWLDPDAVAAARRAGVLEELLDQELGAFRAAMLGEGSDD